MQWIKLTDGNYIKLSSKAEADSQSPEALMHILCIRETFGPPSEVKCNFWASVEGIGGWIMIQTKYMCDGVKKLLHTTSLQKIISFQNSRSAMAILVSIFAASGVLPCSASCSSIHRSRMARCRMAILCMHLSRHSSCGSSHLHCWFTSMRHGIRARRSSFTFLWLH